MKAEPIKTGWRAIETQIINETAEVTACVDVSVDFKAPHANYVDPQAIRELEITYATAAYLARAANGYEKAIEALNELRNGPWLRHDDDCNIALHGCDCGLRAAQQKAREALELAKEKA